VRSELAAVADRLMACDTPFLIGVRHHSAACAAAMPAWLESARPDRVFVELPEEAAPWIEWLGHPEAEAPLALAAGADAFWPFADFSPELVAIRWAVVCGVPVECFDLPIARRAPSDARHGPEDGVDLPDWDTLVETPATGSTPEQTRRAALLYGWALRRARGARPSDLAREAWMRARLAAFPGVRAVVVTGAFHDAGLHPDPRVDPVARVDAIPGSGPPPVVSLLPWRMDLLDARSGYPAGIADPSWHARVYASLTTGAPIADRVAEVMVEVVRAVRADRHVAGTPDAAEALRMALSLAEVRGLAAPGRAEILEAITTALAQGEVLGRGRVIARALERVLVGAGRGRLAPGTPRSGLLPHVEALVAALRLPDADEREEKLVRLDPLRSDLDRRRHVLLRRLVALHVPYAILADTEDDTLTHAWRLRWEPATEAALGLAGAFGATLEQAVTGALVRETPYDDGEDAPSAADELSWLTTAAECGLPRLVATALAGLSGGLALRARLPEVVEAVGLVDRVLRGHVPGLAAEGSPPGSPGAIAPFVLDPAVLTETRAALYTAAVRALDGLTGSNDPADAHALGALVRLALAEDRATDGRLGVAIDALAHDGAPRIAGAAEAARLRLGRVSAEELGAAVAAGIEGAESDDGRRALGDRLGGLLSALGPLLEALPPLLDGIAGPVEALPDAAFLARLPALRHAFDARSTADRARLYAVVADRLAEGREAAHEGDLDAAADAETAAIDAAARAVLVAAGLWPAEVPDLASPDLRPAARVHPAHALPPLTRWRLLLGRDSNALDGAAARYAAALDELYGQGHGEGSRGEGGGRGSAFPTAREWSDEIEALFGEGVRVEVLGRAAERGDAHALLLLDPETVTPSVTLLEQALSLRGGLSEAQLAGLRRLCKRVTDALVEALAVRVRPAFTGLASPRPTRRRADRLHLRRTVEANLRTATPTADGWRILPERPYFRERARREMDWHVVLVVDTSGSMEASVVYAAMMAAILASLPAVAVSFYAFADEVIDLTDRVDDPLELLLGVQIGGGTRIHRALRYARERIRVPTRTLLLLLTDFEEGGSPGALVAEVRALVEMGVTPLGLAALGDDAKPRFHEPTAARVAAAGMPVAALSPLELARWVAERIRG
jgi:hypothetical protein